MTTKGILAVTVVLGIAGVAAAAGQEERVFELRTYYAPEGRLDDLQARFRDHTLTVRRQGLTSIGYSVLNDNPDNKLVYLLAFPNREAREAAWKDFMADPAGWKSASRRKPRAPSWPKSNRSCWRHGRLAGDQADGGGERVFELRTYTAAPGKLENLNARFRDHTVKLFEKHGMTNIGYWNPIEGQPAPARR